MTHAVRLVPPPLRGLAHRAIARRVHRVAALLLLAATCVPVDGRAQGESAAAAAPARDTAALILRGRVVTVFRAALGASSPRDRADAAARRWREVLAVGAASLPPGLLAAVRMARAAVAAVHDGGTGALG